MCGRTDDLERVEADDRSVTAHVYYKLLGSGRAFVLLVALAAAWCISVYTGRGRVG